MNRSALVPMLSLAFLLWPSANMKAAAPLYGIDFGPYLPGQDPNINPQVSPEQISARLKTIAPYTRWVRSYSTTTGLEKIPPIAHSLNLKIAASAWISTNLSQNSNEINNLIAAAQAGSIDMAIVGTEVLLRGDVTETQLLAYMAQVRSAIPVNIPVTTAETWATLLAHPNIIAASDIVAADIYPYWDGVSIGNAMCAFVSDYDQIVTAANGKPVLIAEAGWPTDGGAQNAASPSEANAAQFLLQFASWATANNVPYFYFEAFDEAWKANYGGGPPEAHWGIWDQNGVLKPLLLPALNGQTTSFACGEPGGQGTPQLFFSYVPPYGDQGDVLQGQALHVSTSQFAVAVYIQVAGAWWTKPTFASPITLLQADGTWSCAINTGGTDYDATAVTAFLIPASYTPPNLGGASDLPTELYQNSVAQATAQRTPNSISGHVTNAYGAPLVGVGVSLTGGDELSTQTAPDGRYSFPNLSSNGAYTVTPSSAQTVFTPSNGTFPNAGSGLTQNFSAVPLAYSITGQVVQNSVPLANVAVSLNGSETIQTDSGGNFSFTNLTPNGDYTLSPTLSGYIFKPPIVSFSGLNANQAASFSAVTGNGQPCVSISDCAYDVLNQRASTNTYGFFVYRDADSAFNHGFASGLFASTDVPLNSVIIDSACLDSPSSATGCSADENHIDVTRGTVFRISLPSLGPSDYVGVNFQDPENYSFGDGSNGYNLTPASAVQFEVRSPAGAHVQFGVGGCVSGPYSIGTVWQQLTIPLSTLHPPKGGSLGVCPPDISNTHILFTVTTDGSQQRSGSTVLLDDIQFLPVPTRASVLSLPVSTQTYGVIPRVADPIPTDQANRNVAAIYESALTVLTLLKRGQAGDVANALEIADAFDYALRHDNRGDRVPSAPDGSVGLHNAYMAGDIALLNAQWSTGAFAGDVRLSGFTGGATLCGKTGFCLVLDGATGGNNAWAMLALISAFFQSGRSYYLTDAETIGRWIIDELQDNTASSLCPGPLAGSGYGGYFVGFNDSGPKGLQQPICGKSTENNGDIFAAFGLITQIESGLGHFSLAQYWRNAAKVAGDFVAQMAIPGGGFYVGTVTVASTQEPGPGNCPSNMTRGNDVINVCEFIDSDTFTILPMAASSSYSSVDWAGALLHVLNLTTSGTMYTQTVSAGGQTYQGFDLVPSAASTGVAFEFTGQMSATCSYLSGLISTPASDIPIFQNCAASYTPQIKAAQSSAPFTDGKGLVASILQNGDQLNPINQCLVTPFQCIPERVGLAATNWAIIADQAFNPMAYAGASFSLSQVTFPSALVVGTSSSPAVVTLSNSGTAPMTITGFSLSGTNPADFAESENCASVGSLAPGSICNIQVTFSPTGPGTRTATLSLNSNAFSGPLMLSGSGVPKDDFSIQVNPATQSTYAGGAVSFAVSSSTAANSQSVSLTVTGVPAGTTANFAPPTISSGGGTTLAISTSTETTPGTYTLTITAAGTEVTHTVIASMTVQSPVSTSASSLTFATQTVGTTSAPQVVTISNSGTATLSIDISVIGPNARDFSAVSGCSSPMNAQASCMLTVSFTPTGTGPRVASLLLQSVGTAPLTIPINGNGAGSCTAISDCGYASLAMAVSADRSSFYVYKDADSGLNHGFPSGVFTSFDISTSSVLIDASCIDSPLSPTGCSGDPNAMDQARGTVLSVTFPKLPSGSFAGLNIQEPMNYVLGDGSNPYKLTGATAVKLDARSPQVLTIRFGVGVCVTPYVQLSTIWKTYQFALDTLVSADNSAACLPDLANVHLLFAVSADGDKAPGGGTVLMDNIALTPVPAVQATVPTLPISTQTFGVTAAANYPIPPDQVNRNLAQVADSALTALAFFARGQATDNQYAVNIASGLDYALHHDNHGDPIHGSEGSAGLHSAYEGGDLGFLNSQPPLIGLGQAGDIRLSGFTASSSLCGPSEFCLVLDGAAGGDNAWAILALASAYVRTGNTTLLNDAESIGNWITASLTDTSSSSFGGYFLGYSDGGLPKQLLVGKSTEQNAVILAAFNTLAQIESMRGAGTTSAMWATRAKVAGDFVLRMFDSTNGRFNSGTLNNIYSTGPAPGVCPSSTQVMGFDTVNTCDFLDSNTIPILAMSRTAAYGPSIDWTLPLNYLSTFANASDAGGSSYVGFGETPAASGAGVAWGFTAEAVAAYESNFQFSHSKVDLYLRSILQAQNSAPFGDGLGIVAATLPNADLVPPIEQCITTPFACIPERVTVGATAWAVLAERRVNPLSPAPSPVSIEPQIIVFQSGGPTIQELTLTNNGTIPVGISPTIAGSSGGSFSVSGCSESLNPGATCSLTVTFFGQLTQPSAAVLSVAQLPSWAVEPFVSTVELSGPIIGGGGPAKHGQFRMYIDAPGANSGSYTGLSTFSGWAINDGAPISSVQASIDGVPYAAASYGVARPDVCAAFPARPGCPNVGWSVSVDTAQFSSGAHVLDVTAKSSDGAHATVSAPFSIAAWSRTTANPMRIWVDNPNSPNATLTGTAVVNGWAIDDLASISNIGLSVDGVPFGTATYGNNRADVCAVYPDRSGCPNVGWSFPLDTTRLVDGPHTLAITAMSSAGAHGTVTALFRASNSTPQNPRRLYIDVPNSNQQPLSGTLSFMGWAIDDDAAVTNVNVSIDNVSYGLASYGVDRPDVCAVFPGRAGCPNVGWQFSLDTTLLTNGSHSLQVTALTGDGQSVSLATSFQVLNAQSNPTRLYIDQPSGQSTLVGITPSAGWAINDNTAISTVAVTIDGTPQGDGNYGANRPEVCVAFPARAGCPNVGWSFPINTTGLADGPHTLTILATAADGQHAAASTAFTVANWTAADPTRVYIDVPSSPNAPLNGTVTIAGWATDDSAAVSNVGVSVDSVPWGSAMYGGNRTDACAVFPNQTGCPNVGWSYQLDTTLFPDGMHVLDITATSAAHQRTITKPFTVMNLTPSNPMRLYVDVPNMQTGPVSGAAQVAGWAINDNAAITTVVLSVDGVPVGTAQYGILRGDVCAVYPARAGCPNVGWNFTLDMTVLANGQHTLDVTATSAMGQRATIGTPFEVHN